MAFLLAHSAWQIDFEPVGPWMGYAFTDLGAEGCCRSLNALSVITGINPEAIGGRPLWPPAVPRLAARSSQSNPRGSGPEVLNHERGHVTAETGVAEVGVFRALQPNGPELH